MGAFENLAGQRFGRLLVISRSEMHSRHIFWDCRCDCGQFVTTRACYLKSAVTRSCGCLKKELQGARIKEARFTHGHSNLNGKPSPTYSTWRAMRKRCSPVKNKNSKHYYERGIRVCERWSSFTNFLNDMGDRPPGKTIDRIDVNGNYQPGNCRWATASEQERNKRKNLVSAS